MGEIRRFVSVANPAQIASGDIDFQKVIANAQRENTEWIEGRFGVIRQNYPLVDGILVDEGGRVVQHWAALQGQAPPSLQEIIRKAQTEGKVLYPLISRQETKIFFLTKTLEFWAERLGQVEAVAYGAIGEEGVSMAFVHSGMLGRFTKDLKKGNMVLGKIGFWPVREKRKPQVEFGLRPVTEVREEMVTVAQLPRVHIKRHPGVGKTVYFTVLPRADVILSGRIPVDERENVYRLEIPQGTDFILGCFVAYTKDSNLSSVPLLLYHIAPRIG